MSDTVLQHPTLTERTIAAGRESLAQKGLQVHVAGQLLGEKKRFQLAVGVELLAVGHDVHHVDAAMK